MIVPPKLSRLARGFRALLLSLQLLLVIMSDELPSQVEYVRLGTSGLKVSKVSKAAWRRVGGN